jgi:HAD superfamily hydrolase (TIGR01490 family)
MKLALFDFDGTVSNQDSLLHFLRFSLTTKDFLIGAFVLTPHLLSYFLGLKSNDIIKAKVVSYFFKSIAEEKFQSICSSYAKQALPSILRPKALDKIDWHKAQGHRVVVVSASIENYLKTWCDSQGIELIATQLEFSENKGFTGKFLTLNCHGPEKVKRIQSLLDCSTYEHIVAYGDSKGDKEMLEIAHESHYKPFA